eukprot:3400411-Rhodomonas_salina.7
MEHLSGRASAQMGQMMCMYGIVSFWGEKGVGASIFCSFIAHVGSVLRGARIGQWDLWRLRSSVQVDAWEIRGCDSVAGNCSGFR